MDTRLALAAYLFPGLAVLVGIPLALGLIPPNRFYGYRTRKAFSSPERWYRANRFSGCALAVAGVVAIVHNTIFVRSHGDWSSSALQLFVTLSTALLLLASVVISAYYTRRL
jgi:uncharacterized membrane protein